jgi:hypothetical protein
VGSGGDCSGCRVRNVTQLLLWCLAQRPRGVCGGVCTLWNHFTEALAASMVSRHIVSSM